MAITSNCGYYVQAHIYAREFFHQPSIVKVYAKHFAIFWPRESF